VALHDLLRATDPAVYRQAIDEYRAQWRFVLPLSPSSRVLDLSCGWGAVALNLAESCELVVAADACPAQALFVAQRVRQMGQGNVFPLQLGLDRSFPFSEGFFDAVVLISVLGWVRGAEAQRLILRRVRDVLRPGGFLFLAEANRLGLDRLVGGRAAGELRTPRGYRAMLQSAGFRDFRMYAPAPSHLEPFFMIPLDRHAPLAYFLREIVGGQDFGIHFRRRGQDALYRLVRMITRHTPSHLLVVLAKPFVPSVAIVAHS
jgi:SAM-dependent methyltransferase